VTRDDSRRAATAAPATRVLVDATACVGVGLCAYLAPDTVSLDSWGFPLVRPGGLTPRQVRSARTAAAACPKRAIHVVDPT
jgi:ferredoxin